jgi:aryl-alcohol dehydrogenase-like predicted oxidoreductase
VERRSLGETGARVGTLGLGTTTWGQGTDPREAREQLAMLIDLGGNLVDIAPSMANADFAASVLADTGLRREAFVSIRISAADSQRDLLAGLDEALATLGLTHADLWTIEGWDPHLPWPELVSSLAIAVATGRARYAGLCPAAAWQVGIVGAGLMMHPDRAPLAAITTPYSLLDRESAEQMAEASQAVGAGVIAAWPLAGGVLTGKYRHATPPDSRGAGERHAARLHPYRSAATRPLVDGLCAAAEGLGTTPAALALAWVRDRPGVAASLAGARTVHQWRAALASSEITVPAEIRRVLDEVADDAARVSHDGGFGSGSA